VLTAYGNAPLHANSTRARAVGLELGLKCRSTGNGALRIERDEIGRAYWADSGARTTAAEVVTCGEDVEARPLA
jgi:hypothetical protein